MDDEIEKLRAEIFFTCQKTKIMLHGEGKFSIGRLRPAFYNTIFTFPEFIFNDFSLAPNQNIDISTKQKMKIQ